VSIRVHSWLNFRFRRRLFCGFRAKSAKIGEKPDFFSVLPRSQQNPEKRSKFLKKTIDTPPRLCDSCATHGNKITDQMRTKTLLLAAAALAVSLATSMAQVYSANIVGYANVAAPSGFTMMVNPLSAGVSNGVDTEVINPSQLQNGNTFYFWNPSTFNYNQAYYTLNGDGLGDNWFDPNNGFAVIPTPTIPPGKGFFYQNVGTSNYFTFVGSVTPSPGTTNTLPLPSGYNLVGSMLPIAGPVDGSAISLYVADGNTLYIWNPGTFNYNQAYYTLNGDGLGDNWFDPNNGFAVIPSPQVTIGQGFFYQNVGSSNAWSQTITNSP
jgi:hypothetical protein